MICTKSYKRDVGGQQQQEDWRRRGKGAGEGMEGPGRVHAREWSINNRKAANARQERLGPRRRGHGIACNPPATNLPAVQLLFPSPARGQGRGPPQPPAVSPPPASLLLTPHRYPPQPSLPRLHQPPCCCCSPHPPSINPAWLLHTLASPSCLSATRLPAAAAPPHLLYKLT